MTANHFDQIAEWYENAERITKTNLPRAGDIIIQPFPIGDGYQIEVDPEDWTPGIVREVGEHARILSRAPKPKPAWHDAPAIIAHTDENPRPSVWTWHKSMDRWDDEGGCHWADTEDLRDVTPLIEAKVTDEMVARALESWRSRSGARSVPDTVRDMLTAAVNIGGDK